MKENEWDRLINNIWPADMPIPSDQEAITGAKRLYRKAMGRPFRGNVVITRGNRYTWIRGRKMSVNPNHRYEGGWRGIVHLISHYCHRQLHPNDRPHSHRQVDLEASLARYAIEHGFHEGRLIRARKEPKAKDVIRERYQRTLAREAKWERKLSRAENALNKARSQRRYYERSYPDRLK